MKKGLIFLLFALAIKQIHAESQNCDYYNNCKVSEFDSYLKSFADYNLCQPKDSTDGVWPEEEKIPPRSSEPMKDQRTKIHDLVQTVRKIFQTLGPAIKKLAKPVLINVVLPALSKVGLKLVVTLALAAVFVLGSALLAMPFCVANPLCPIAANLLIFASGSVLANPMLLNAIVVILMKIVQMLARIVGIPV